MALNVVKQPAPKIQNLITQLSTRPHSERTVVAVSDLGKILLGTNISKRSFEVVESSLIKSLTSRNKNMRKSAYYHLKCAGNKVSNFARASIDVFKRKPVNKSIVEDIAMHHWLS